MKLSIVDQSPIPSGMTASEALGHTVDLARLADRLGYTRYWIAEHHAMRSLASPAPEILIARIGAATSRIRVGSGAVLLPHYAPIKVAEQFQMLEALYPGRVDLGLGRAPGGSQLESMALRRDRRSPEVDDFGQQLLELIAFLDREFPEDHPFGRIHLSPATAAPPDLWLLGSSLWSAAAAAQLGLNYAFAHFIAPQPTEEALAYYRERFTPSTRLPAPNAIVALGVICADTTAEAEQLMLTRRAMYRRIRRGDRRPIPTPAEALEELGPGPYPDDLEGGRWPLTIWGDPPAVKAQLDQITTALAIDEIMAITVVHDPAARRRSYELLAEMYGIRG